jgi:NAD(P)-dependent dehydrogenase (short-subunit alcohol dehydrogenase family)
VSNENWTSTDITDLTGKVIIVTGGNSGLGYESVKAFAEKGAEVILASRSLKKGEEARKQIGRVRGKIRVMQLELQDFSSIEAFAEKYKKEYKKLDVLLNNAGIMMTPYFLTKEWLEGQIGTNHFGHFMLTGLLIDLIKNTPESRVINVSSSAHKAGKMDFDNLLFEKGGYSPIKAYGRSKLANLLFTYELQRRFAANDVDSIAVAAHPGVSRTNLGRHINKKLWYKMLNPIFGLISQSQEMGALSQIRASVDHDVKGGEYYGPNKRTKGSPVLVESNKVSHNINDAKKLWDESERITKVKYF